MGRHPLATLMLVGAAGCAPDAPLGEAQEGICSGYYVAQLHAEEGTVYVVSPETMVDASEAWGPQTLLLAVDQHLGPQISLQQTPGVQVDKEKVTKSLQRASGVNLTAEVEITASSSTTVVEGAYVRLEAYPTYQRTTWQLWVDACGPNPSSYVTSGAVLRPVGMYFRVVTLVRPPASGSTDAGAGPQPNSITAIGSPVVGYEAVHN
jgi:hypothetical protein